MRVLLTGATGFIGRALCARLLREGHAVTAWVRDEARAREALGPQVALLTDPARSAGADDAAVSQAVAESEAIVNLAGEPIVGKRWTEDHKAVLLASRTGITGRLARAVARAERRPAVFVSASAVGFYGDRGDEVLDERSAPGAGFLSEICVAWEQASAEAEQAGVRRALIRIGVVLGKDGGALAKMLPPFRLGVGGKLGSGDQWMSWIHLDDVLGLLMSALGDARYAGPINAVAPTPVTNRDFTAALGEALHRPTVLTVPAAALKLALGEAAVTVLGSQRVLPRAAESLGFRYAHPELLEALRDVV